MKWFADAPEVYIHRDYVDFRKAVNGLVMIIEQQMELSPYCDAVFVFCSRSKDKLKIIHWDRSGFVMWYKRLEKSKYLWPVKHEAQVIELSAEQLQWLLSGFDILKMKGHTRLYFE